MDANAFVGVGSNLENPSLQVARAMDALNSIEQTRVVKRSSMYWSEPVGFAEQPQFVNAVCALRSALAPLTLLTNLLQIEDGFGRVRTQLANRPRIIDLDLLLYGQQILGTDRIALPHPRMHQRRFVLEPLVEIAPEIDIPGKGQAHEWLARCMQQDVRVQN